MFVWVSDSDLDLLLGSAVSLNVLTIVGECVESSVGEQEALNDPVADGVGGGVIVSVYVRLFICDTDSVGVEVAVGGGVTVSVNVADGVGGGVTDVRVPVNSPVGVAVNVLDGVGSVTDVVTLISVHFEKMLLVQPVMPSPLN